MRSRTDIQDATNLMLRQGANRGLLLRTAEDEALDGRLVTIDGRELVNFGSCSYLGLEMDARLKQGAIEAIQRYGTQFSASRGYLSLPLYTQLETILEEVFGVPPVVTPTTSLGHVTALPLLIREDDMVLIDQQVHASVQTALNHVKVHGVEVEVMRHNRLDLLEARLRSVDAKRRVWYMADGVYSMYGDMAPLDELRSLLARYPQLHMYLDDAHAMSWCGPKGSGHATSLLRDQDRVVIATSLNKAFAAGGAVLLTTDPELRGKFQTIGPSQTFSGPMQPAALGAAIASATLHADGSLVPLQAGLNARIRHFNDLCAKAGLPLVSSAPVPIRFIAAGKPQVVYTLVERLMNEGFYTNCATFPVVPMTRAGIRITLTLHQTLEDIERLVAAIARHLPDALESEGLSLREVRQTFGLAEPGPAPYEELTLVVPAPELILSRYGSISELSAAEWDGWLGDRGIFTADGLRQLEGVFGAAEKMEEHWRFHYYVVRNRNGKAILATFFTEALWKDDVLAPIEVSAEVERRRETDPYFLTSKTLSMGSLLTEGNHLYLDKTEDWRGALGLLLREVERQRERSGAAALALRDLPVCDEELGQVLLDRGYMRLSMPESTWMPLGWSDEAAYMARLSAKSRLHQRKKVLPFEDCFTTEVVDRSLTDEEHTHLYRLYLDVKARNLNLNCFDLPPTLFRALEDQSAWEFVLLRLKPEYGGDASGLPVAYMVSFKGSEQYVPLLCGLDYRFVRSHGAYRQLLRQVIQLANRRGFDRLYFGFGASHEKTRFGARLLHNHLYVQNANHYHFEVLRELMSTSPTRLARKLDR